jgi:hypothetical protein
MTAEEMTKLGIPAEYHGEQIFKDAPDLPTVFKVASDLNKYKGSSIRIPGPEAAESDRKEFTEKLKKHAPNLVALPEKAEDREPALLDYLGVPKEAKEYAPPVDHGLSKEVIEALQVEAAEAKLTKGQFARRVEQAKKGAADRSAAEKAQMDALKKDLGQAFEDRLITAAAAAKNLGLPEAQVQAIKEGKVPAETVKLFINAAKALGTEPGDLGARDGGGPKRLTPDEIQTRIGEIYKNPAFMDKSHPQNRALIEKLVEYQGILNPEDKE